MESFASLLPKEAIPQLLMIQCILNTQSAMLLVQGTRGGKSAVPQIFVAITRSFTLIIENTLSLSTDQYSKIKQANIVYGPIKAFHPDSMQAKRN